MLPMDLSAIDASPAQQHTFTAYFRIILFTDYNYYNLNVFLSD